MNIDELVRDVDKIDIESCVNSILKGQCILFLGPNFSVDQEGNKVHDLIKTQLQTEFPEKLDYSYENLYIFKDPATKSPEKMKLNIALKKIYRSITPGKIYDKIAAIPFSAIISCSPEKYLIEAHSKLGYAYNFQYYSRKGVNKLKEDFIDKATFIYNVFGDIEVEDSLINSYEAFYKFVISILGDQQALPSELTDQIAESTIFLFMGFDLTKWYIPLMVHKLHGFKQDSRDTTMAVLNRDNTFDSQTPKFLPIDIAVSNNNSEIVIETLHNLLNERSALKEVSLGNSVEFEEIRELIASNKIEQGISRLQEVYRERSIDRSDLDALSAQFEEYQDDKAFGILNHEQAATEKKKIVRSLLQLTKRIK